MPTLIDSENVISNIASAPDKLRAQIGLYYTKTQNGRLKRPTDKSDGRIKRFEITPATSNDQLLIPTKRHKVMILGEERFFRDHSQWSDFVNSTIKSGNSFLDHQVTFNDPLVTNDFLKSFHDPRYEDATKQYPSNQLLNYNLLAYLHSDDSDTVQKIGFLKTPFDSTTPTIEKLLTEFEGRILNYDGDAEEINVKQRNIFILDPSKKFSFKIYRDQEGVVRSPFPYSLKKTVGQFTGTVEFREILDQYGKTKNLFQSIKSDLSFGNRNFTINDGSTVQAKIYNAISLLTSTSLSRFSENSDELYLLKKDEINHSDPSERFLNNINTVRFLSRFRNFITDNNRSIEEIFNTQECKYFVLGYKIEKYLDNDATSPIQTYYTVSPRFDDTQMKYGRKYIYKTKVLIGILGSDYGYSNIQVATEDLQENPTDFMVSDNKYWAIADIEVKPSFQILEYQIEDVEVAFVDSPTLAPHVSFYGKKDDACVNFLFMPRYNSVGEQESPELTKVGNLRPEDRLIKNLYAISGEKRASSMYFTGIYEVYRTKIPPANKQFFKDYYLTTVDQSTIYEYIQQNLPNEVVDMTNAHYKDMILPNQKYYYAFRAITYHGTPSELTPPIEVELMKDSDEYKISVKEYRYPNNKRYTFEKRLKRLFRIVPNPYRLDFTDTFDSSSWDLDDGSLVTSKAASKSQLTPNYKTFKIRVTSKHTGKKMDLNITFKLKKDDSFN